MFLIKYIVLETIRKKREKLKKEEEMKEKCFCLWQICTAMNSSMTMLMDIAFTNVNIVTVISGRLDLFGMVLTWDASLRYNENYPEVIFLLITRMKKNLKHINSME